MKSLNHFRSDLLKSLAITATVIIILLSASTAGAVTRRISVVVEGLHSPRGLAFGPGDILYVAQAGDAENAGSIIEIRNSMSQNARYRTIITDIPTQGAEGEFLGISGISVLGRGSFMSIYGVTGESPQAAGDSSFGRLFKTSVNGNTTDITNIGSFDYIWTGDHSFLWEEFPDANPYGVLALPGRIYVADAGANTLDLVLPDGTSSVLAYFPNTLLRDAIPTCVTQGPDGALYIGTLALVDSIVFGPSAKVYRVDPNNVNLADPTHTPMAEWATGISPINGCTFGPDGNFYASELFTNTFEDPQGDVVKIPFNDPATHISLADGSLSYAGGVAVAPNGDVFVADGTAFVDNGRVLRIRNR